MKGFTDLNVDFAYTELDVRFNLPVTKEKLKVQADVYKRVTQSCVRNKRCVGITVWVCALVLATWSTIANMTARACLV